MLGSTNAAEKSSLEVESGKTTEAGNLSNIYCSKRRILKNVILLGFAFLLDTTPIIGLSRLQSR